MRQWDTATDEGRVTGALTLAAIATYLLIALGATVATRGAAGSCGTWPGCAVDAEFGTVLAVAHRGAALVAGLLVAVAAVAVRRAAVGRRIRLLTYAAVVTYPVQIFLGGIVATGGSAASGRLHLFAAVGIFAVLLAALVLALEETTETAGRDEHEMPLEPAPGPDAGTEPEGEPGRTVDAGRSTVLETARAYVSLTKPRLMWLLCLLALGGIGLAALSGAAVDGVTVVATLAGGVLAIGASGTANHLLERDRDRRMERTADRPLATDKVSHRGAAAFAAALTIASLSIMWTLTTPLATFLTAIAMVYYGVVYTVILKPNTRWSTLVGGGAGALPAVIGWAAVTGGIGLPGVLLALVVVLWTPAHFYNLALAYRDDYARGGYPLVPVVCGAKSARRRIVAYLGATLLTASALGAVTELGALYAIVGVVLGGVFLLAVVEQYRVRTGEAALKTFHASNAFLGALLAAILVEAALVV